MEIDLEESCLSAAISKNRERYWLGRWGKNYFDINEKGHLEVLPGRGGKGFDLYEITQSVVKKGTLSPILFRFNGIIQDRVSQICTSFERAIQEAGYKGRYQPVYPIKVNPQKHVVELVRKAGSQWNMGLEVGSKPELLAILTTSFRKEDMVLCNGFKDAGYIELVLGAVKLGRRCLIIIEQLYELDLVIAIAKKLKVVPELGFRMKLHALGSGKWASSGGDQAKFGLTTTEIIQGLDRLQKEGSLNCLKLLHFHVGSQITSIRSFEKALSEATRMYAEIGKIAPSVHYFDVGGGLAVDYEGASTSSDFSANYTIDIYAKKIVSRIAKICDKAKLPHPVIITESGRAMVAYHSVLVMEMISSTKREDSILVPPAHFHLLLHNLYKLYETVSPSNGLGVIESATELREQIIELFIDGKVTLFEKAAADSLLKQIIVKGEKEEDLVDLYFGNFSLFQSLPDIWAIQQIFPLLPIHRLDTWPSKVATLVDLTCDSDGKIDRFLAEGRRSRTIAVHELDSEPYYIGVFLVGAYQEILGNRHNLFGNTPIVHVDCNGEISVEIPGSTNLDMLYSVQYDPRDLEDAIEEAIAKKTFQEDESVVLRTLFNKALNESTYLQMKNYRGDL